MEIITDEDEEEQLLSTSVVVFEPIERGMKNEKEIRTDRIIHIDRIAIINIDLSNDKKKVA